ncbi:MAG: hypothetical protein AB9869_16755 [Verrucomicrobiia bacterium]
MPSRGFNVRAAVNAREKHPDKWAENILREHGNGQDEITRPLKSALESVSALDAKNEVQLLACVAERALAALASKSRNGDGDALWHFASSAIMAAEGLSQITRANPKALVPVAQGHVRWPLMTSTHPFVSDKQSLLREIKLGSSYPWLQLDKYSKWKKDTASAIAFELVKYLDEARQDNLEIVFACGSVGRMRKVLPAFSKETAEKWWLFAKDALLQSYPEPQNVPELASICTTPSRRKSKGRIKEAIVSKIRKRFFAMAAYHV